MSGPVYFDDFIRTPADYYHLDAYDTNYGWRWVRYCGNTGYAEVDFVHKLQMRSASGADPYLYGVPHQGRNIRFEANARLVGATHFMVWRATAANGNSANLNCYAIYPYKNIKGYRLMKINNNSLTTLTDIVPAVEPAYSDVFVIEHIEDQMTFYINGAVIYSYTHDEFTEGTVGLLGRSGYGQTDGYDNIQISFLDTDEPPPAITAKKKTFCLL